MDPQLTDPQVREARMLAAIVFTDVVGFSKLAAQHEARVYGALQRDMGVMTNLCRAHGGQVLNTMGDGMLLCFTSAVDAMACSVEIQRTLHNQSHSLPAVEILHHRIGVHLGDVIMNGDNIFGDGVNVAARLQSLAKPDAVCFSQTVYEVVKNKLKLDANYLGPRQLKNLGEPVRVWQVPPIDERASNLGNQNDPIPVSSEPDKPVGASGMKAAMLVAVSIVMIAAVVFGFMKIKAPKMGLDAMPSRPTAFGTAFKKHLKDQEQPDATDTTPPAPVKPSVSALEAQAATLKKSYSFTKLVDFVTLNRDVLPEEALKLETYQTLAGLETYLQAQGAAASAMNPIQVTHFDTPNGAGVTSVRVYAPGGVLTVESDTMGARTMSWGDLTPVEYLEIATAAVNQPIDTGTAITDGAAALQLFSKEYGAVVTS